MALSYSWSDAEFHDPEVINGTGQHPDFGALARMMAENQTWVAEHPVQRLDELLPWN